MKDFVTLCQQKFEQILASITRARREGEFSLNLDISSKGATEDEKLFITISDDNDQKFSIAVPIPYTDEHGNLVIGHRVKRAVGSWFFKGREFSYWKLMTSLLTENVEEGFPDLGMRVQLERLVSSFGTTYTALAFRDVQEVINSVVNRLPLAGTPYEAWAMCKRVVFLDPSFDGLMPKEALEYQKNLNVKHYPWTSLGLSDSSMVENYLLKEDLRKFTPFGIKHHNPKRNLYQTLGMKGSETPVVLTKSAKLLAKQGVERTGWNLMTVYADLPLNFEDQIIMDLRHLDKVTCEERRFVCFGEVSLCAGDSLNEGDVISTEPGGKEIRYWVKADNSVVSAVNEDVVPFNGSQRKVFVVTVRTSHIFKEGVKLTNCHGNKGVVTFADCGEMYDAGRMCTTPIDIIVSAKTIGKRKNYGQVIEVLMTLIAGTDKELIFADDAEVKPEVLKQTLERKGYNPDGTSPITTQWGNFNAICGWGFWGVIKNPENQVWGKSEVMATDNRQLRTAGLKLSHIEFKALMTNFGPKNAVVEEILSYQQGVSDVKEMVQVLEVMCGKAYDGSVISWRAVKPLFQSGSYFHPQEDLAGSIVDETFHPDGFALEIPRIYHVFIPDDPQAAPTEKLLGKDETDLEMAAYPGGQNIFINKIVVPSIRLRNSWQHPTGLYGMSDMGGFLNSLVVACHKLDSGESDEAYLSRALNKYFTHISTRLSTKRGEVATYALSVRYPNSAKATATLAKPGTLGENCIEIHESMARNLNVRSGDYVIAERFPCLGFKSLRIQKVQVTSDPQCKFVIRVSGNSLVSQNLDFDGDVLFLMSFKTKEANAALAKEFLTPEPLRQHYLDEANQAKVPTTGTVTLDEVGLMSFPYLTAEKQAEIVGDLTGIKRGTGTAVALAYNLMRIIEGTVGYDDRDTNLAMEVILDKVANSVFSQKHAGVSLEERCKTAVCKGSVSDMLAMGFPEAGSRRLCEIIREEAEALGITDLDGHFDRHLTKGNSNIINLIVRKKHKLYFATRSNLHPARLLEHLASPPTDLVSYLWRKSLSNVKEVSACQEDVKQETLVA